MKIGRFNLLDNGKPEDEYNDPPRPFLEHLIDLRDCVIRCAVSWLASMVIIAPFAPTVVRWLTRPSPAVEQMVQGLNVMIGVEMLLKVMLWGGTILSMPLLLFFISRFVFPGLKRSERTIIIFSLCASVVLFTGGVWMAYDKTLAIALDVLQKINRWMGIKVEMLTLNEYIAFVLKTIVAFGVAFQLPLLILVLGWMGLIPSETLRSKRRIAIVVIFALAMVLTPPDPVSQIMMAVPMCLLYEACIWIIKVRELTKRKKREARDA